MHRVRRIGNVVCHLTQKRQRTICLLVNGKIWFKMLATSQPNLQPQTTHGIPESRTYGHTKTPAGASHIAQWTRVKDLEIRSPGRAYYSESLVRLCGSCGPL
eukprot:jgi/Botrbrau1/2384/Bobra.0395s0016.1